MVRILTQAQAVVRAQALVLGAIALGSAVALGVVPRPTDCAVADSDSS